MPNKHVTWATHIMSHQNQWDTTSHPWGRPSSKSQKQRKCGEIRTLTRCCWWECKVIALTLENILAVPHKFKNRVTIWPTARCIPRKTENISMQKLVHEYSWQLYAQQTNKWKPKCPSLSEWVTHTTVRPHSGVLLGPKNGTEHRDMLQGHKPQKHAKWKQPVTKNHTGWCQWYETPRMSKSTDRKHISGWQGWWKGERASDC